MWFEIPGLAHAKGISRPGLDLIQQSFYNGTGRAVELGLQELPGCDSPRLGQGTRARLSVGSPSVGEVGM